MLCSVGIGWNGTLLLKTGAAEHGSALRRLERDSCFIAAYRAIRARLSAHTASTGTALRLALFAALGIVGKVFIVKK